MNRLNQDELLDINGGFSFLAAVGIGAVIVFISGIIDGIARPFGCRR